MPEVLSAVEYRDVQGFPGYRVGSDGSVWTCWRERKRTLTGTWKLLNGSINRSRPGSHGRRAVYLFREGKRTSFYVHRLVLEAFIGPRPDGTEACHGERGSLDNAVDNLRWDTHQENMRDLRRHGTELLGEMRSITRLTKDQVREARQRIRLGESYQAVGKDMNVHPTTIWYAVKRKSWRHITD